MHSLRARFSILVGILLVVSVTLQAFAAGTTSYAYPVDGTVVQPSLVVPVVLSTLATFCVATAVALVLGIVASYLIDETSARGSRDR